MTFPNPIPVDLFKFFTKGMFDCIRPGQTKDWILPNFPDPDSKHDMEHGMSIWLYGTIEFHFEGEILFLIHCDNFDHFGAGDGIALDKWLLSEAGDVALTDVLSELHHHKVSYAAEYNHREHGVILRIAGSGVKLYVSLEDGIDYNGAGTDDFTLGAFSLLHPDDSGAGA